MLPSKCASKSIRNLERPRPPKWMTETIPRPLPYKSVAEVGDEVLQDLEALVKHCTNSNVGLAMSNLIVKVCQELKLYGAALEARNAVRLDRCFVALRNIATDTRFDPGCRFRILQIIELRSMGWKNTEHFENNYRNRFLEAELMNPMSSFAHNSTVASVPSTMSGNFAYRPANSSSTNPFMLISNPAPLPTSVSVLSPGEVLKSSGKYTKPTKIPAKNYFKDEIIIRNSDSGKVVQGAKDRLVQVTGPTEETIGCAKGLIEETIRRNVSPIRDRQNPLQTSESATSLVSPLYRGDEFGSQTSALMHSLSMSDASIAEYQFTVAVGRDMLTLSGGSYNTVKIAKLVLEEYFAGDAKRTIYEPDKDPVTQPDVRPKQPLTPLLKQRNGNGRHLSRSSTHTASFLKSHVSESSSDSDDDTYIETKSVSKPLTGMRRASKPLFEPRKGAKPLIETRRDAKPLIETRRDSKPLIETGRDSNPLIETGRDSKPLIETGRDSKPLIEMRKGSKTFELEKLIEKMVTKKIAYDRNFLLDCSASPYSQSTPKDLPKIIKDLSYILKKTADFFDPIPYKKQQLNSAVLNSATVTYWPFNVGSSGSQENEDYDPPPN